MKDYVDRIDPDKTYSPNEIRELAEKLQISSLERISSRRPKKGAEIIKNLQSLGLIN